ncbi:MAG: hypothetical protein ACXW1A_05355 [Nitrososphaeraceae archaeon]
MLLLYSLLGSVVIAITVTWYFSWYFSKKAEKVVIDISGFIIQEITKNPNYVYPYYVGTGKDRKLHKGVLAAPIKITGKLNATATGVKRE